MTKFVVVCWVLIDAVAPHYLRWLGCFMCLFVIRHFLLLSHVLGEAVRKVAGVMLRLGLMLGSSYFGIRDHLVLLFTDADTYWLKSNLVE